MTTEEIEVEIDQAAQAKLGFDMTATSNASDWKSWRGITAQLIFSVRTLWEYFKTEVLGIVANSRYGNNAWWHKIMLEFQYGDALLEKDGVLYYDAIDESKKIIKRVAITEQLIGQILVVQIKVAKLDGTDTVPLEPDEKTAATYYITDRKPAGIATQLVSLLPDEVKTTEVIYYDGKLDAGDLADTLLAARKNYLANIVFNGQFSINKYRDEIEKVAGVEDVDIQSVSIKPNGGAYSSVTRLYNPTSGHYKLNDGECTFTLIAQ